MDINDERLPNSEEIIFYLDLCSDFMKKRTLLKAIDSFMGEKNEFSGNISYGLVLFKREKDIFSIYNKNPDYILDTIDDIWEERDENKSYFENGLYEILAHIFKRSRKDPKRYQIIVFSDSVSDLSDEYHSALYNLILKAKLFSTTINIIRLGEKKFYSDDVRLKIISSETHGATLYCDDRKNIDTYLNSLVKSQESINILKSQTQQILDDDYSFYEKLATDLISLSSDDENLCILCEQETCPICETFSDELHKCYNCNAPFHNCCAAEFSITNRIGFNNIFRCPRCGALLKLDKEFVDKILEEKLEEQEEETEEKRSPLIEFYPQEEIISQNDNKIEFNNSEKTPQIPAKKKVRIGGFFGTEIELSSLNGSTKEDNQVDFRNNEEKEEKVSITSLKPPKSNIKLKLCPICGATVKQSIYCPVCGSKID